MYVVVFGYGVFGGEVDCVDVYGCEFWGVGDVDVVFCYDFDFVFGCGDECVECVDVVDCGGCVV